MRISCNESLWVIEVGILHLRPTLVSCQQMTHDRTLHVIVRMLSLHVQRYRFARYRNRFCSLLKWLVHSAYCTHEAGLSVLSTYNPPIALWHFMTTD
jgi:hypothetical protein